MNKNLKQKTNEWMQLERKTLEQYRKAEDFYENHLMSLIVDDFVKRNKGLVTEEVKYLVLSVGTSYEPMVLNINLLKPERILFLYTEKSEIILNKVVKHCGLQPNQFSKSLVSETNPLDIYREIKKCYLEWKKQTNMYIDFTGGTKAMSAAAAMAASIIDVQLVYIGTTDYLADFRKPNPGSEELYFINNPLAVFGDLEIEKAYALFDMYNYAGAVEKLEILKEDIPDPNIRQQLNFVYLLAKCYEAWDALDFVPAYDYLKNLNRQLKRDRSMHPNFLLMDFAEILNSQEKILNNMICIPEIIKKKENVKILQVNL